MNLEDQKILKLNIPITCPCCQEQFYLATQSMPSCVTGIYTLEDIQNAKKKIIASLEEITFASPEDKDEILEYINAEATILEPSDIEPVLKQISMDQLERIQAKQNKKTNK